VRCIDRPGERWSERPHGRAAARRARDAVGQLDDAVRGHRAELSVGAALGGAGARGDVGNAVAALQALEGWRWGSENDRQGELEGWEGECVSAGRLRGRCPPTPQPRAISRAWGCAVLGPTSSTTPAPSTPRLLGSPAGYSPVLRGDIQGGRGSGVGAGRPLRARV
jgi:hypothetical protein